MTRLQRLAAKGSARSLQAHLESLGGAGPQAEELADALRYALAAPSREKVELLLGAGADPGRPGCEGDQVLAYAAIGGDPVLVRKMLGLGCDPDHANVNGRTPLIWAASFGRAEAARILIEAGADPNAVPRAGSCPLLEALKTKRGPEVPLLLIAAGADVSARTPDDGRTPLHLAAGNGSIEVVRELLRRGADIHARGGLHKEQPLHAACRGGDAETVLLLLESGADPRARDGRKHTPLALALPWDLPTIRLLVERAPGPVNVVCGGRTPLDSAAAAGATEVVDFLLEHGARVQGKGEGGRSALVSAVIGLRGETVRRLLEHPGTDLDYRWGVPRQTALMMALQTRGGEDLALHLLAAGAGIGIRDEQGRTALHHAVRGAAVRVAARLLDLGLPVDDPCRGGVTPLMLAAGNDDALLLREDRVAMARLVLERGGDVHARDVSGRRPLHHVAVGLGADVARLLLQAGADVNAVDGDRQTLLYLAASHGALDDRYRRPRSREEDVMADLIEYLLDRGADPALAGPYGPPLRQATVLRCPEVVRMIEARSARKT